MTALDVLLDAIEHDAMVFVLFYVDGIRFAIVREASRGQVR